MASGKRTTSLWKPIFAARDCHFINLQFGDVEADLVRLEQAAGGAVVTWFEDLDLMQDLDGVAALMCALDLIIAVPNTNVHLAGALGRPVWMPFDPQWGCFWVVKWQRRAVVSDGAGRFKRRIDSVARRWRRHSPWSRIAGSRTKT